MSSSTARRWLPVLLWMGVIFVASTNLGSNAHTSLLIDPILHLFFGNRLSVESIDNVHFAVRKLAHLTEYAFLGMLLFNALRAHPARSFVQAAAMALLGAALYAASDEFHQSFVASRTASARDVLIDTVGAALGISALWANTRLRLKRAEAPPPDHPLPDRF